MDGVWRLYRRQFHNETIVRAGRRSLQDVHHSKKVRLLLGAVVVRRACQSRSTRKKRRVLEEVACSKKVCWVWYYLVGGKPSTSFFCQRLRRSQRRCALEAITLNDALPSHVNSLSVRICESLEGASSFAWRFARFVPLAFACK